MSTAEQQQLFDDAGPWFVEPALNEADAGLWLDESGVEQMGEAGLSTTPARERAVIAFFTMKLDETRKTLDLQSQAMKALSRELGNVRAYIETFL